MKLKFLLLCTFLTILLINITPATAVTDTLEITDPSNVTHSFTYQQLAEMPTTTIYAELYCYGSLVTSGDWSGVQLNHLLTITNANSEVKSIQLTASDSYTVTIPVELAVAPETIIAYQKDGEPVAGLRLVLPGVNGASWIAQIVSITMSPAEVDSPPTASGPGGRGNLANIIENSKIPPTITPEQQPTPQPVPESPTPHPTVPPENITIGPIPTKQTADYQPITLDGVTKGATAFVFATGLAIAGIVSVTLIALTKNRKKKDVRVQ
jgi:DMSO/TMAO reductase YedYZ molybdopterin-dependent catalytic subunit